MNLFKNYLFSLERKKLENALVDEILKLSSIPKCNDLKIILEKLSKSRNKIISDNFKEVLLKIEKGHKPKEVFENLKKKYNSEILDRFLDLIYLSTTTGTISFLDYKSVADNFIKTKQVLDERGSNLLMQKYTIIFAGGLIVPGILGIVVSLIKSLKNGITTDIVTSASTSLYTITYYCVIIYIIEYVIISSFYLSLLEDNRKKAIIYLIILLPVSLLIFFLSMLL